MKTKDQILLEKVYSKMVLKEAFDLNSLPEHLKILFQERPTSWLGNIDINTVEGDIDLSFLEKCIGSIYALNAKSLDLRNLESCNTVSAEKATYVNLENLKICTGGINLWNYEGYLDLRNLEYCKGDISIGNSINVDLRNLIECRVFFNSKSTKNINLSKLEICKSIYAAGVESINLSNLKECDGYIYLVSAKYINLSNLKYCLTEISVNNAETIIIPEKVKSKLKNLQNTCKVYNSIEEYKKEKIDKTGFEPEKILDPRQAEKLGGLFFNRNEN